VRLRRLMLAMSRKKLGDELGITFQQVQKYEKGTNRISASRLMAIGHILQVPLPFFFDGSPQLAEQLQGDSETLSPAYVSDFLASGHGHALMRAFSVIKNPAVRRSVVRLIEEIVVDS
jgi:transcriptional regulator with XRE-family HTH domain